METNVTVSRTKIVLMWGAILGVVLYGVSFIDRALEGSTAWSIVSFILKVALFLGCMGMSVKQWRDKGLGGYIGYGKAFGQALLTGLFATLLLTIITLVALQFVGEDYKKELEAKKLEEIAKLEDQGADESAIEWTEKIFNWLADPKVIAAMILVMFTIASVIMALIVAAIYKKDDPNNFGMA
jgi:hypothetical protein